ncbi:MAG: hypothetical protein ACP5G1_00570 [Nanopusillaceae archaeon]
MSDRFFEALIIIVVSFIVTILLLEKIAYSYSINYQYADSFERFIEGRMIIRILTEKISNNICNLTINNFNYDIINQTIASYGINRPYSILYKNLETGEEISLGLNITGEFISFSRVCNYNGQLYLVRVMIT